MIIVVMNLPLIINRTSSPGCDVSVPKSLMAICHFDGV